MIPHFKNKVTGKYQSFLVQWDTNVDFEFLASNLTQCEVAFSTYGLERAIVKTATKATDLGTGMWRCKVSDTALQSGYPVFAYITDPSDGDIRVVDIAEIQVIPRTKPADYISTMDDRFVGIEVYYEKIQEIKNSIPSDYSELIEKVNAMSPMKISYIENLIGGDV